MSAPSALESSVADVSVFLTPLYGTSRTRASCFILDVDDCRVLLDCGWNDAFDTSLIAPLRAIAPTVDAVLLTHATVEHAGALPALVSHLRAKCSIFATQPVFRLGQLAAYDTFFGRSHDPSFSAFTLDDVDATYKMDSFGGPFSQLRFLQEALVKGVTVSPVLAGHTLGGAAWRITKGAEVVVYASGLCLRSERLLSKSSLGAGAGLRQPSALLLDVSEAAGRSHASPSAVTTPSAPAGGDALDPTDTQLRAVISSVISAGGSVLMPTDTAGRALELVLRLSGFWGGSPALGELFFLCQLAPKVLEFCRILSEYVNPKLAGAAVNDQSKDAFALPHVKVVSTLEEFKQRRSLRPGGSPAPCVVITSSASLDSGFAHTLFMQWHAQPTSCVLFTHSGTVHEGSVAWSLLSKAAAVTTDSADSVGSPFGLAALPVRFMPHDSASSKASVPLRLSTMPGAVSSRITVTVQQVTRVRLVGAELRKWKEARAEEARQEARAAEAARVQAAVEAEIAKNIADSASRGVADDISSRGTAASGMLGAVSDDGVDDGYTRVVPDPAAAELRRTLRAIAAISQLHSDAGAGSASSSDTFSAQHRASGLLSSGTAFRVFGLDDSGSRLPWSSAYGQDIPPDMFTLPVSGQPDADGDGDDAAAAAAAAAAPVSEAEAATVPTKIVRAALPVTVHCQVAYVDVEGAADASSILHLISELQPRIVVALRGDSRSADSVAAASIVSDIGKVASKVITPAVGERIDISSHARQFSARLRDALFASAIFQRVGEGYDVAHINAEVAADSSLVLQPPRPDACELEAGRVPSLLRVGSVRIMDVHKRLQRAGIPADLVEGGLVTQGAGILVLRPRTLPLEPPAVSESPRARPVAAARETGAGPAGVSRSESAPAPMHDGPSETDSDRAYLDAAPGFGFTLEGPLCDEYFAVRAALYSLYTQV